MDWLGWDGASWEEAGRGSSGRDTDGETGVGVGRSSTRSSTAGRWIGACWAGRSGRRGRGTASRRQSSSQTQHRQRAAYRVWVNRAVSIKSGPPALRPGRGPPSGSKTHSWRPPLSSFSRSCRSSRSFCWSPPLGQSSHKIPGGASVQPGRAPSGCQRPGSPPGNPGGIAVALALPAHRDKALFHEAGEVGIDGVGGPLEGDQGPGPGRPVEYPGRRPTGLSSLQFGVRQSSHKPSSYYVKCS